MNLLNKTALLILAVTAFSLFRPSHALAQIPGQSGAATEYQITITKVEICDDSTCSNPTELGNTTQAFDIASVSTGADIGQFATTGGIPVGVPHSHVRVTLNRAVTITGNVDIISNTAALCTTRNGQTQGGTSQLGLGTTGASGTATSQVLFIPSEGVTLRRGSDNASTGTSITAGTFSGTFNIDSRP